MWLGAGHTRGHGALDTFGLFDRYTGTLVSDDYNGYAKYQVRLTARQLCNAHLIRTGRARPRQSPAARPGSRDHRDTASRAQERTHAVAAGQRPAGQEIEQIRAAYREQAQAGITANRGVGRLPSPGTRDCVVPGQERPCAAGWGSSAIPGTRSLCAASIDPDSSGLRWLAAAVLAREPDASWRVFWMMMS